MNTASEKPVKSLPKERAHQEFIKMLAAAETRGFHGTATLTVTVMDGTIQYVKVATERVVK
jgi:hypothetical protein